MNYKLIGELFVVAMVLVLSSRIFLNKEPRVDSVTILAPLSFITSVLLVLCWGVRVPEILLLCMTGLVLIANFNALGRLIYNLFVDHYNAVFIVFSTLMIFVSLGLGALIFHNREVIVIPERFHVSRQVIALKGTVETGFTPVKRDPDKLLQDKVTARMEIYRPDAYKGGLNPVLLFSGDRRSNLSDYAPYLVKLSSKGWTVVAFKLDTGWEGLFDRARYIKRLWGNPYLVHEESIALQSEFAMELLALVQLGIDILPQEEMSSFYLMADELNAPALPVAGSAYREQTSASGGDYKWPMLKGLIDISGIPEYNKGLGCIEQTDPWLALYLGTRRDPTLYGAESMAHWTIKRINKEV